MGIPLAEEGRGHFRRDVSPARARPLDHSFRLRTEVTKTQARVFG